MTSFDLDVVTVGLAAGLGAGFITVTAVRRRNTKRRTELAQIYAGRTRRRIDVVAIDSGAGRPPSESKSNQPNGPAS
jgi:hypothetical protein